MSEIHKGENSGMWKGDKAGKVALHRWIEKRKLKIKVIEGLQYKYKKIIKEIDDKEKELSIKGIKVSLVPESASLTFEGDKFKLQASLKASAESQDTIPESTAGEFIE
jgi:hypothetical protein